MIRHVAMLGGMTIGLLALGLGIGVTAAALAQRRPAADVESLRLLTTPRTPARPKTRTSPRPTDEATTGARLAWTDYCGEIRDGGYQR